MRFDTSQHMRLGQSMKLAPRVIQSMEILQMPLAELEQRIEQELESNAALEQIEPGEADRERPDGGGEQREPREGEPTEPDASIDDTGRDDFERLDAFEADNPDALENQYSASGLTSDFARLLDGNAGSGIGSTRLDGERDGKQDAMAQAPARQQPLVEQ